MGYGCDASTSQLLQANLEVQLATVACAVHSLDVKASGGSVTCSMTAMPKELKQDFKLVWVGDSPRLVGVVNGVECWMEKLWVLRWSGCS